MNDIVLQIIYHHRNIATPFAITVSVRDVVIVHRALYISDKQTHDNGSKELEILIKNSNSDEDKVRSCFHFIHNSEFHICRVSRP